MTLKELSDSAEHEYEMYLRACEAIVNKLCSKFGEGIIDDVIWQMSDGLVLVWGDGCNTPLLPNVITGLRTKQQFIEYLEENVI